MRSGGAKGGGGGGGGAGTGPYGYLLEPHLLLAAVGLAATVNLQRHDLPVAADVSEDLRTGDNRSVTPPCHLRA